MSQRQVTTCRTCAPVAVPAVAAARWPGAAAGAATSAYYHILPSAWFLGGGVPAGLVGGRHTQPGSTRTPSPACGSGKHRSWLNRGAAALHPLGRRRWQRRPQAIRVLPRIRARPSNCSRNPRRPVVPLWGGDIPRAPGCSLEVTIRWLWGVKQPSRPTCSATDQIGASAPAGADPSVGSPSGTALCSRCVDVGSPKRYPRCPSAPWESGSSGRFRD